MNRLNDVYAALVQLVRRNPQLTAATATTALLACSLQLYRDYNLFLSYGPGGPPHNVYGWLLSRFLVTPFSWNMFSTTMYDTSIRRGETESYLETPLPKRKGERPRVGPHAIPQRQMDQFPPDQMRGELMSSFMALASSNKESVRISPSNLERHTEAMWLADCIQPTPSAARWTNGEFAHIHATGDHSLHVVLSPADAKQVLAAGWGQRHALMGWGSLVSYAPNLLHMPTGYVLVYAPRDEEELQLVLRIVKASMRFMTGREVN
ncbi:hypothetical protein ASPZODRAFT_76577 [Penicilliopsis zonata CBS 506.65]|uniref:Luciferase domain-containing protein n=1 Tax=Penicilliopsis zonata CBS 506.65 TaxID=1073090 RepID=A0A1L9S5V3_9EURO|nr:hypothetical protein ASPZODRAFT_76577 [Penicilliopsis zonata CBS 506.65]OJJ42546.1 hypothetical protein ASPZODRAFT_76577 [Penicilliopsis zonata CBS 506.65]